MSGVREYIRGNEWWGQRDDGTWVRWNAQTMDWDPQPAPPASSELHEVTRERPASTEHPGEGGGDLQPTSVTTGEVDPDTGLPLPPGSKVYRWEFKKTFGPPPEKAPPGARTFRFSFGKRFGPFPLEDELGPDSPPEELRRTAPRGVFRQSLGIGIALLVAVVVGGALLVLWLTNAL
jgi:hypothetical protein